MRARVSVQQVETPLKQSQNFAPREIQQGKAQEMLKQWTNILSRTPEDVTDS